MEDPIVRQAEDDQTQQAASLEHSVEEASEVQIDSAYKYIARDRSGRNGIWMDLLMPRERPKRAWQANNCWRRIGSDQWKTRIVLNRMPKGIEQL